MSSTDREEIRREIEALVAEAERRVRDGDLRGGRTSFERAVGAAAALRGTLAYNDAFAHTDALSRVASAQVGAGEIKAAGKTFRLAKRAARDAASSITSANDRARKAVEISVAETDAYLGAGAFRAAGKAAGAIADPTEALRAWVRVGRAVAATGNGDEVTRCFARARQCASRLDTGLAESWIAAIDDWEAEAFAHGATPDVAAISGAHAAELQNVAQARNAVEAGDSTAIARLVNGLASRDADARRAAINALADLCFAEVPIGPEPVDAMIAALAHSDPVVRRKAAATLCSIGSRQPATAQSLATGQPERIAAGLIAALADRDGEVRTHAAEAFTHLQDAAACDALLRCATNRNLFTRRKTVALRRNAVAALGHLGGDNVVDALLDIMWKDPSITVRNEAVRSLAKIGDPRALHDLGRAIADGKIGHAASGAVLEFRDRGMVSPEQMAFLRAGMPDDAFGRHAATRRSGRPPAGTSGRGRRRTGRSSPRAASRGRGLGRPASSVWVLAFFAGAILVNPVLTAVLLDSFLAAKFASAHLWSLDVLGEWRWLALLVVGFCLVLLGFVAFSFPAVIGLMAVMPFLPDLDALLRNIAPDFYSAWGGSLILWGAGAVLMFLIGAGSDSDSDFRFAFAAVFPAAFLALDQGFAHWLPDLYLDLGGFPNIWTIEAGFLVAALVAGVYVLVEDTVLQLVPSGLYVAALLMVVSVDGGRFYDAYVAGEPDYAALPWQELGEANRSFDHNQTATAIVAYRSAAFRSPGLAPAYEGLGHALFGIKQYAEAENAYSHAIALDGMSSGAYLGRGMVRWFTGNVQDAARDYRRLVQIDPQYLHFIEFARVLYELGRPREAADMWGQAADVLNMRTAALIRRMFALERAGAWREIRDEAPALMRRKDMKNARVPFLYGRALNEARRHEAAIAPLRRAVALLRATTPLDATTFHEFAEELMYTYVWAGRRDEARRWQLEAQRVLKAATGAKP